VHSVRVTIALITLLFGCASNQIRAAEKTGERHARAAQCFLEVNGVHRAGGDCLFTPLDKIGSFRITTDKGLSAQVTVKVAHEGYASWSGPQGGDATAMSLGDAYSDMRGCWDADDPHDITKQTHVCAWDKSQRLYLGPRPDEPRWSLAWGERAGMYARIISSSGLDTDDASIMAEKSRDGAIIWCRVGHDYSTECIRHTLEDDTGLARAKTTLHGNCKSKKYTDFWGRNLKQLDDDILNLDTNDKLGVSTAAGTWVAQTAFEALCPKAAVAKR
jgi:hypothetical protein